MRAHLTLPLIVALAAGSMAALPSRSAAVATVPTERVVYSFAPLFGSATSGVWSSSPDFADPELINADAEFGAVPHGGQLAWLATDATWQRWTLHISSVGQAAVRTIDLPTAAGERVSWADVAWSPDGSRLAIASHRLLIGSQPTVERSDIWTVPADGSAAPALVPFSEGLFNPAFDPTDPARLYAGSHNGLKTLRMGEPQVPVPGTGGISAARVQVTPDGRRLVYLTFGDMSSGPQRQQVLTIGVDGTRRRVLDPLPGSAFVTDLALSLDGRNVYYTRFVGFVGGSSTNDVFRVPVDGSATRRNLTNTPYLNEYGLSVVGGSARDTRAAHHVRAALAGSRASLTWTLPAGTRRVVLRRASGATPVGNGDVLYTGRAITSYADKVAVGRTYTYAVWAVDAAGVAHGPTRHRLTATAQPNFVITPTVRPRFQVTWGLAANSPTTSYHLQWAARGVTGIQGIWRVGNFGPRLHGYFGGQTTQGVFGPRAASPGGTWAMRGRAMDRYGNFSLWSRTALASSPYDDTAATLTGPWKRGRTPTAAWLGTVTTTRARGAAATFRVHGSRFTLLGSRTPTTGKIAVYLDGRLVATRDTRAPKLLTRAPLWVSGPLSLRSPHTLRVVALGTPGRPLVVLDGLLAPH